MSDESATPELTELTRQAVDAWMRHDLDSVMGFFASEAVFDMSDVGLGTFEAVAIRGFLEDWAGTWGDYLAEIEEIVDLGHGVVFVCAREVARLSGSDSEVEQHRGWVHVWVDRKLEAFIGYLDPDKARAAAERLAEEPG
jgi:ketosteroid isomerase-like protein